MMQTSVEQPERENEAQKQAAVRVQRLVRGHWWCELHLGDALEIAPRVNTLMEIGGVISDPPYGIRHSSSHGASWMDTEIHNDHSTEVRDALWEMFKDKPRAMCGSWKQPPPSDCRGVLIYDKGDAGSGDLSFPWKPSWEEIYVAGQGWSGKRDRGILTGPQMTTWETGAGHDGKNGRTHPHEKPVWLMARLIEKLPTAEIILDPFMGSGTTGVACLRLGVNFIGIESDPKHFATAFARLEREANQGALL